MWQTDVKAFYHEDSSTITYVAADADRGRAAIIDPVLDFDPASGRTDSVAADAVLAHVAERKLTVDWLIDTHIHADHLSAVAYLKDRLGAPTAIGSRISDVQKAFRGLFNAEPSFSTDGSQFDRLFNDGETFAVGGIDAMALHTPGHTPACTSWLIGDAVFVGDTVFMPDFGTSRCDFPGGSAAALWQSIQRLLALAPETRVFVGHDYGTKTREPAWETTVAAQRADNIHVGGDADEESFVSVRQARDATLPVPRLLLPAIQVNMRGGHLPPAEANGIIYLKIPLNTL